MRGEAGESVRWSVEAQAGTRGGGFDLACCEDARRAGMAGGEVPADLLTLRERKFPVDPCTQGFRVEMFG